MNEIGDLVVRLIADIREFMGKFDEAEAKVGQFAGAAEKSSTRFGNAMSKMGTAVLGATAVIAGYGLKAAYDYGKAIEAIGFQSGASQQEVDSLRKSILDISVATATSATDLANAFVVIEQAGFRGTQATQLGTNAAKLAKLTNTDLITSTKDLVAVQALQLNGNKDIASTTAMLVELNKQHVGTLDSLSGLFDKKLAATLKTFNISLASAGAGMVAITKHGIDASVATQGLTVGITKLLTPSAKIDKTLQGIGLSQRKIADDMHKPNGLFVTLSDLKTHLLNAGVQAQDFGGYISSITGARGAAGLGVMMQYLGDMQKAYPDLLNSQQKFSDSWAKFQQTPEFKFDKLKAEFNQAMIGIGNLVLPVVINIADAITKAADYVKKHPLVQELLWAGAATAIGAAIVSKVGGLIRTITGASTTAETGVLVSQGVMEINYLRQIAINTGFIKGAPKSTGGSVEPTPGETASTAAGGLMGWLSRLFTSPTTAAGVTLGTAALAEWYSNSLKDTDTTLTAANAKSVLSKAGFGKEAIGNVLATLAKNPKASASLITGEGLTPSIDIMRNVDKKHYHMFEQFLGDSISQANNYTLSGQIKIQATIK